MRRASRPLLYGGVLAVVFSLAVVHARWIGHYAFTGSTRFAWTAVYAAILCVLAYGFGLPDAHRDRRSALGASVGAAFLGAFAISLVQLFVGDALLPRFVVFGSALLLPDWYRLCVAMSAGGRSRAEARDRVVVVGDPDDVCALDRELHAVPERPALMVAHLSVDEATETPSGDRPLESLIASGGPSVIVLDRHAQDVPSIVNQVAAAHERGVRVRSLTLFYEEWLGKLPIPELERASLLFDIGEVHRAGYGRAKRIVDIPIALAGTLVLAAVIPLVWLGNLAGNRGPLLYRQDRVGKGGQVFRILKFRTMRPRPSGELLNEWTTEDDPRITPFGRVLRRTHVDELPQVLNILRGDLGVVGPRPEQPSYVEELSAKLPFYPLRHLVRPGLTGWAQVNYGYAGSESDALEKLQYEFWYLRHQNVRTDARVIGRTIRSVIRRGGR